MPHNASKVWCPAADRTALQPCGTRRLAGRGISQGQLTARARLARHLSGRLPGCGGCARFGRRGLEEGHVWEFCRLAEREVVRLLNERTSLADEVQRLRQRVLAGPGSGVRPEDAHVEAVAILSRAQQAADRYVADAQDYCRQLTDDATRLGEEILAEARSRAALVLEEAHGQPGLAAGA